MGAQSLFSLQGMDRWVQRREDSGDEERSRDARQDVPCLSSWHSTHHQQGWKPFDPLSPGKGLVMPVLDKMCPQQCGDSSIPVDPSSGSFQILVLPSTGPHSWGEAPPQEAAWEGARRMRVSCRRAVPPTGTWGTACGCPAGSPQVWSPTVPLPAVLGAGDKAVTLRQVSSLGALTGAQPP